MENEKNYLKIKEIDYSWQDFLVFRGAGVLYYNKF